MEILAGFIAGWLVTRVIASLTRNAEPGTIERRIHIAIVGPWRPK